MLSVIRVWLGAIANGIKALKTTSEWNTLQIPFSTHHKSQQESDHSRYSYAELLSNTFFEQQKSEIFYNVHP